MLATPIDFAMFVMILGLGAVLWGCGLILAGFAWHIFRGD